MRLIYSFDFLTHGDKQNIAPQLFNSLVFSSIAVVGKIPVSLNELGFGRTKFFALSNIIPTERYFFFDSIIKKESKEYLSKFLKEQTLLIFEAQEKTKKLLDELKVTYINVWVHPFKLLDDLAFVFESNDLSIQRRLLEFQIPRIDFAFYAAYWQSRISFLPNFKKINDHLDDNSLLLIGQTETDKSIERDGIMLSFNDFIHTISIYKRQFNKIYYRPHPYYYRDKSKFPQLLKFLKDNPEIELIECSTYHLLASNKIKKVVAISSSVLFEAEFFGKEIEYLYRPLFNPEIGIIHDLYSPHFWGKILLNKSLISSFQFKNPQNKIRNLIPSEGYWGYGELDNEKILLDFKDKVRKKLRRFPFNLFQRKIKL